MWLARDKDGTLIVYLDKPTRIPLELDNNLGRWCNYYDDFGVDYTDTIELDSSLFPDLKWEDAPIQVDIVKHCNYINQACIPDQFSDICNECKNNTFKEIRKKNI